MNSFFDLPSSLPDSEFSELIWENGQITIQGQSTILKKSSILKDNESGDAVAPKFTTKYAMDDSATVGFSGRMEPNMKDYGTNSLLNCSIDDYFMDILSEFPESNCNSISSRVSTVDDDGCNNFCQLVRDSNTSDQVASSKTHPKGSVPGRIKNLQFNQVPPQYCSSSISNSKSREPDAVARNCTTTGQISSWSSVNGKGKYSRQDLGITRHPSPPSDQLNNFSHFTRPVAHLKTSLQNVGRLNTGEGAFTSTSSSPVKPAVLEPSDGLKSSSRADHLDETAARVDIKSTTELIEELVSVDNSEIFNWKDASQDKNVGQKLKRWPSDILPSGDLVITKNLLNTRNHQMGKQSEPVVVSSAVFSGNASGTVSNEPNRSVKRKIQEGDDSGYQTEDLDDDSTIKKPATDHSSTAKRSRAAEIHNLSERRRRDRINEKMRHLQELIPNCNKVDKASMLDEAIEYLKTLQLQVQMMSMGGDLCMPPLMLPPGMHHLIPPQMAHFIPLDVGMGFGMGTPDTYGSPMFSVPQFPCSSFPGNKDISGSTGHQMFGIPGQRHSVPVPTPGPPIVPVQLHSPMKTFVPEVPETKALHVKTAEMENLSCKFR